MSRIALVQTCKACPEQYDAYFDGNKVGYLRVRHGHFTVSFPGVEGEIIYSSEIEGDGMFTKDERKYFLFAAKKAILDEINRLNKLDRIDTHAKTPYAGSR